jgi:hypothetical protein
MLPSGHLYTYIYTPVAESSHLCWVAYKELEDLKSVKLNGRALVLEQLQTHKRSKSSHGALNPSNHHIFDRPRVIWGHFHVQGIERKPRMHESRLNWEKDWRLQDARPSGKVGGPFQSTCITILRFEVSEMYFVITLKFVLSRSSSIRSLRDCRCVA